MVTFLNKQINMEIREYELTWSEIDNQNANDVSLEYIGMKTLISKETCW